MSKKDLGISLGERGFTKDRNKELGRYWKGVKLGSGDASGTGDAW